VGEKVLEAERSGKTRYRDLAEELGVSGANVKVRVHHGRAKLRVLILEELKETTSNAG